MRFRFLRWEVEGSLLEALVQYQHDMLSCGGSYLEE